MIITCALDSSISFPPVRILPWSRCKSEEAVLLLLVSILPQSSEYVDIIWGLLSIIKHISIDKFELKFPINICSIGYSYSKNILIFLSFSTFKKKYYLLEDLIHLKIYITFC